MKTKEMDLLSEKGKKVLELKKVLLLNFGNDLVYDGLLSSIKEADYPNEVYTALGNLQCDEVKFQTILMGIEEYTNTKEVKKQLDGVRVKVSNHLEKRKGQKHFSTTTNVSKGCISVIKKIGINKDFIQREFRLTKREVDKLIQDDQFVEQYAKLKLRAVVKGIVETIEKEHGNHDLIKMELSDFYHDRNSGYYNVDVMANISITEKQLKEASRTVTSVSVYLDHALNTMTKVFYKTVNG